MENLFITGCDRNTEWQLPWFWENYSEYNDTPLLFVDFGVSKEQENGSSIISVNLSHFQNKNTMSQHKR